MDIDHLTQQLLLTRDAQALAAPDLGQMADQVVERLKGEADRHWAIDPNQSLALAQLIVAIGQARHDQRQMALGHMARGDALKLLGQLPEAWEELVLAGDLFQSAGDEVGWARTCIGRLYLGVQLKRVADALQGADQARAIFLRHGETEKLLRLNLQTALVYNYLGEQRQALAWFRSALELAHALGERGQQYLGPLQTNLGFAFDALGDLQQAQVYYERARALFLERGETLNQATVEINLAYLARAQGHYPLALRQLHAVLDETEQRFPATALVARCDLVECYLGLSRYAEARDLARQVAEAYRRSGDTFQLARALLHLAASEAGLAEFAAAGAAVEEAAEHFAALGAHTWAASARMLLGQLALRQGQLQQAFQAATVAAERFEAAGQMASLAAAHLLLARAALSAGRLAAAAAGGRSSLRYARRYNVPALRYGAHLLLGQASEARGSDSQAARHYQAAMATTRRVERGLTITLRSGFLEDKEEAPRRLIGLHLRAGRAEAALETLEQAKSQVLLGYLVNRGHLLWSQAGERGRALSEALARLRAEHQWFYQLAHEPNQDPDRAASLTPEQARVEVAARERQMRAITEQLYLHANADRITQTVPTMSVAGIQANLPAGTLLVEYYNDGARLWAFTIDQGALQVTPLPGTADDVHHLLAQLQLNLAAALGLGPRAQSARVLTPLAQRLLRQLDTRLLAPLQLSAACRRLVVVPYGALHYLPFHLLHDGQRYLIDRCEVVVQPAAGMVTRAAPRRPAGALAMAHSWNGRLAHSHAEAEMVQRLFGGDRYVEEAAQRTVLAAEPRQILHIAAHGRYRLDQPDLSYLHLADGQLYADDLLQNDLRYELVTLSACETGRANVAGADELIGLGRGLLYAGAGALLLSLWSVADSLTVAFMQHFYQDLLAGASKAAALRAAQRTARVEQPALHPAFWGAFQLVGDAGPLSSIDSTIAEGSNHG